MTGAGEHPGKLRRGIEQLRYAPGHVHNDWLEYPVEYGAGALLLLAILLYWPVQLLGQGNRSASIALLTMGGGLVLAHALVDFPFQSGSVLAFFALSWATVVGPHFSYKSA